MNIRVQKIERKRIIFDCDNDEEKTKAFISLRDFRITSSGPTIVLKNVPGGRCYVEGERVIKSRYSKEE